MPELNDFEKQDEQRELSRAEKRRAAREKKEAKLLTFREFTFWMDRYTENMLHPLAARVNWLMLPWYRRHWIQLKGTVLAVPSWPGRLKLWLQGQWAGWKGRRAARQRIRKARKMERLDAKEADRAAG